MSAAFGKEAVARSRRSASFHRWRSRKDHAVRWLIAVGGVGVIIAVVLIFFYLLWVVFPLFLPASSSMGESRPMPGWEAGNPVYFSLEEQLEIGLRVTEDGNAAFFNIPLPKTVPPTVNATQGSVAKRQSNMQRRIPTGLNCPTS